MRRRFSVLAKIKAGLRSNGIAVHPDGKRLYVSNGGDATVSVIDLELEQRSQRFRSASGRGTWRSRRTARSSTSRAAAPGSVSVIDTGRNEKIADIAVGKLPWGVAIR